ncbi:hypothetical protein FPHYL_11570 [Fusarium phyllophilum]|uniref:Uncharacterized protein n=1 Tax=Fusarium phyllophilum TaxID=47803 RepID=A0A8H5IX80_9HYPO|nr:hypothetical protein FPHYL_11570 [Fusarium phyllophilum]
MAPNNNNKKETPEVLGSVSQYSSRYNAGAARRNDGKRGQASSTSGTVRKKVHEDEDSGPTSTGNGSGDAKHLPSGGASTNRLPSGRQTVYEHLPSGGVSLNRLPSGRQPVYEHSSSDGVSLNRLPSGRQNNHGHLPSSSVSMVTPLPSNVRGENDVVMKGPEPSERPSHGQAVDSKDEDGNVGALTRESEFDEFPDSDLDGLLEADIEQLIGPALSRAPVVDEDDGQKTRENVVEEFLDSDLDSLSEADIQRLLDQAVPKSAKAVDGNDSEAPAMDVGESHMGVEPIDVDAQILEEDRIDAYVSNVEDDGMECFIDEEFVPEDVRENEPLTATEVTGVALRAEQTFYDRAWIVCDRLCQSARAEREWDSDKSPLSVGSWNWFRKAESGELADIVYNRVFPEARRALSVPRPDVLDLLELPEPKREDLADSCNDAGVYVFVCHAERKVDPRSGDLEAIDNDSVGCYTGQSIAMPQKNGREGMSLRFDQHRRELRRTIPELEEKAKKASTNVPRFYRTVVENKLEAHPRVVATLPRDGHLAAHAMLIETVIMIMTGSVSEESSNGLPTKDIVADIQEQLAFEGRLRYQPKTLNRALPVRQGFRVNVRVSKNCQSCENNSSNYKLGFHMSQFTQKCLCRSCICKEITERCRPELAEMGRVAILVIPKERDTCESPCCASQGDRQRAFGWSAVYTDLVLCQSCRFREGWAVDKEIMESLKPPGGQPTEEEKDGLVCPDPKCNDPRQARKKKVKWAPSAIARLDGVLVWLCVSCRNREHATKAGKQAQKTLEERRDRGIFVPGLAPKKITPDMRYCRYDDCHSMVDGVAPQLKKGAVEWSIHPAHLNWVVCKNCKLRERKLLVAEEKKRRGDIVTRRGFTIKEDDKVCTEEGCGDPRQEAVQQRMEAGQMIQSGHIWYRHPMPEEEGRVLCAPCRKAVLLKMTREAILRALERPDVPEDPEDHENPTRLRGG